MATIKIQRTSEYINSMRDYQILIDGQKVGGVANGDTRFFEIAEGKHKIFSKIGWCRSPEIAIDLNDNETMSLKVGGFKYSNWIMPISFGIIVVNFVLKYTFNIDYGRYLIGIVTLLLIYFVTFGRKQYLTLTEIF